MGAIAKAASGIQRAKAAPAKGIQGLLQKNWTSIEQVMPAGTSSSRLQRMAVSAINQSPDLVEATPQTILSCVLKCAALGLEPSAVDGLGRAYILPYRNRKKNIVEAQFILGYRGIIELCRRSGKLKSIHAQAVYQGDSFDSWEDETGQHFTFRPARDVPHTPATLTDVYVNAQLTDGGFVFERMTKAEVDAIRSRSRAANNGPWATDYEAMALKTVIRRAAKYLPLTVQAQEAVAADESTPNYQEVFSPVVEVEAEVVPDDAYGTLIDEAYVEDVAGEEM